MTMIALDSVIPLKSISKLFIEICQGMMIVRLTDI
jgi:hypothetical protein